MVRQVIPATRRVGALDSKYAYDPEQLAIDVALKEELRKAVKSEIKQFLLAQFKRKLHSDTVYGLIIDSVKEVKEEELDL